MRWLMLQFGPLPWAGFFYVGALTYRSVAVRKAQTRPWWIFFGALTVLSLFAGFGPFGRGLSGIDAVMMHTFLDMMLRAYPHYMMISVGSCGLLYLLSRRYYRGAANYANAAARWVSGQLERLGVESFLFLIMHWWLISTTLLASHDHGRLERLVGLPPLELLPAGRVAIVMAGVLLLLGPVGRLRDWLTPRRRFRGLMYAAMATSLLGAAMVLSATRRMEAAMYLTYGASFAFAFVYPKLRADLRNRYTRPTAA
jgi:hypothetical protein